MNATFDGKPATGPARAMFAAAVHEAAEDEGRTCPTCRGESTLPGGRLIIQALVAGATEEWLDQDVLDLIARADTVRWNHEDSPHPLYPLEVYADGFLHRFRVRNPAHAPLPTAPSAR